MTIRNAEGVSPTPTEPQGGGGGYLAEPEPLLADLPYALRCQGNDGPHHSKGNMAQAACLGGEARTSGYLARCYEVTPVIPPLVIVVACFVIAIVIVVAIRRVVNANKQMFTTRVMAERAKVRAETAEHTAERIVDVAENAIARTGEALSVARKIDKVSEQMDALMTHVAIDSADVPSTGKHARTDLHALPGGQDGRSVA